MSLPCRHIFFARKLADVELFTLNMVPDRLKLRAEIQLADSIDLNLETKIADLNSVQSFMEPNMTSTQRYNAYFRVG